MADEETKLDAIIVQGRTIQQVRDKGTGKFVKKNRKTIDVSLVNEQIKKYFSRTYQGPDGKVDRDARTRIDKVAQSMFEVATMETDDPKALSAKVAAGKLIFERVLGRVAPSPEEIESNKIASIKSIVIVQPNNVPVRDGDKPREKPEPPLLEAEIVDE